MRPSAGRRPDHIGLATPAGELAIRSEPFRHRAATGDVGDRRRLGDQACFALHEEARPRGPARSRPRWTGPSAWRSPDRRMGRRLTRSAAQVGCEQRRPV
ncbi:hypothetical protein [Streptomyces sp. NPDC001508]|uniref:hypothetical protein n=1 Tax=Streptomyces sp. NPDC001508 TaxID=3154656 RepID=UPI003321F5BA